MQRKLTIDVEKEIYEKKMNGMRSKDILEEYGINKKLLSRIMHRCEEQNRIVELKQYGYTYQEIVDQLHISKTKISNVLNNRDADRDVDRDADGDADGDAVPDVSYKAKYDDLKKKYEIQEEYVHYLTKRIEYLQWRNVK